MSDRVLVGVRESERETRHDTQERGEMRRGRPLRERDINQDTQERVDYRETSKHL